MPSIEVLLAFTAAAFIMNLSPGPSNLYVMARAIAQGTQAGLVAALGLAVGSLVHVVATVFGLSALFVHSPTLYIVVKFAGAAYLIFLGVRFWTTKSTVEGHCEPKQKPLASVFKESVVVEVSNPKTALFFIAFLPQFVAPEAGSVALQFFVLGMIVTLSALPCDVLVAVTGSKMSNWLVTHSRAQQIQNRLSGLLLFCMGLYIFADEAVVSIDR